ncbi:MAG TPA: hypothetical protein GXX17_00715 [Clostridiales bacterium]|nr:hypothetical protein [Clostridiales bacterium]
MKPFLKKINRGVILSLLIILGIACYYGVIAIKDAPHKKEIERLLEGFYSDFEGVFFVPEEYLREGITEEQVKPLYSDIKAKLRPYFASEEDLETFFSDQVKEQIYFQTVQPNNQIKTHTCKFEKLRTVRLNHKKGTASVEAVYSHDSSQTFYDIEYENGRVIRTNPREYSQGVFSANCAFSLIQTDSGWKISKMQTKHWF